jgi:hypothetical protein
MLQSTKYCNGTKFIGYVLQFSNRGNWMKSMLGMNVLRNSPDCLQRRPGFHKYQHEPLTKQDVVQYITN